MDIDRLRAETRAEHEAVEALVPLLSPGLTRERYREVLGCMYRVVRGWEEWAAIHAPRHLAACVRERRRAALLESDLQYLQYLNKDESSAPGTRTTPIFTDGAPIPEGYNDPQAFEAAFLGAMYVMEGSTLGGQHIARHVEAVLGFEPGIGDAYFRGHGQQTGAMWQSFKRLLIAVPDEHSLHVLGAAKAMFACFGDAMRGCTAQ